LPHHPCGEKAAPGGEAQLRLSLGRHCARDGELKCACGAGSATGCGADNSKSTSPRRSAFTARWSKIIARLVAKGASSAARHWLSSRVAKRGDSPGSIPSRRIYATPGVESAKLPDLR